MGQRPWIIALTGPPGAGKSTTAGALARQLGAALLDQDSMTNALVDVIAKQVGVGDYGDPRLAALVREPRYDSLLRVAADCAAAGVSSVLVAPFTAERRDAGVWEAFAQRVRDHGGEPRLVWLRISAADLADRLARRGASRDAAKLSDLDGYVRGLDLGAPAAPALAVDAMLPPEQQAREVVRLLDGVTRATAD